MFEFCCQGAAPKSRVRALGLGGETFCSRFYETAHARDSNALFLQKSDARAKKQMHFV